MPTPKVANTPNILLLMVDQMRADAMGCAGNTEICTPGLDRMATEGMRFTRGYSNVPVCIPARHSTMTGQPCSVHQRPTLTIPDPEPALPTIPHLLGLAGYRTHAIGKMHWRPVRRHYGFHRMELMEEIPDWRDEDEYLLYLQENGYGHVREVHGIRNILYHLPQVSLIPEEHHGSTWVADRTIDFLEQNAANGNRPFFCFSSWIAPHPPWNPPEPYASMYDPESLSLPETWDRNPETLPPSIRWMTRFADVRNASPEMLRRIKALYYGSVSLIDRGVGRILNTLDRLGLSENTLVVFTSDHGEMLGEQHAFQKAIPYEPAARVPFLMRMPGRVHQGAVSEQFVSLLDIMPTALDLAEIQYPEPHAEPHPLPGRSLLEREGGGLAEDRDHIVLELGHDGGRWLSVRQGDWRYAYYLAGGWRELYNLTLDPNERHNLLDGGTSEHLAIADALHARIVEWERAHGYASSFDDEGELRTLPFEERTQTFHNNQFPRWVARLNPEERRAMQSAEASLDEAIQYETTFDLKSLEESGSLGVWRKNVERYGSVPKG